VIDKRYADFLFGTIQSGATTAVTAAIATGLVLHVQAAFLLWVRAWLLAWLAMIPLIALLAPLNRRIVAFLTRDYRGSLATRSRCNSADGDS
jgi:hypothetical protein